MCVDISTVGQHHHMKQILVNRCIWKLNKTFTMGMRLNVCVCVHYMYILQVSFTVHSSGLQDDRDNSYHRFNNTKLKCSLNIKTQNHQLYNFTTGTQSCVHITVTSWNMLHAGTLYANTVLQTQSTHTYTACTYLQVHTCLQNLRIRIE